MTDTDLPDEHTVRAWMSNPEHTAPPGMPIDEAFALMKREDIRHLLVVDDDELVGLVTDRDLRRPVKDGVMVSLADLYRLGDELTVGDVMSDEVVTVEPDEHIATAARIMVENKFNCLPVTNDDRVVGIVTSSDLLAALVSEADPVAVESRRDL